MLTGLTNRRAFLRRLSGTLQACCHQRQMALLFIDLDGFKTLNDSYGHDFGDVILKTFAKLLSACAGERHSVSRTAGDEFTVILWPLTVPRREVNEFCERCWRSWPAFRRSVNKGLPVRQHWRGDLFERRGDGGNAVGSADSAMYQAKSAGKGTYAICEL